VLLEGEEEVVEITHWCMKYKLVYKFMYPMMADYLQEVGE
jgi:hypothetical protein